MPEFYSDGIRTYITSYSLPTPPEFDDTNNQERNPREAPPFALHEEIRVDRHEFMEDGLMLPSYDRNRLPVQYCKITAQPGDPLQVHLMIWSQQVIHDIDLPKGEDEFLDIRAELSLNGRIIDVAYVSHKDIKPSGLPVGIEFVGERSGDAKELPMLFTSLPSLSTEELKISNLNVLVTLGRMGDYFFYDETKIMSKKVRTGPVDGKYESSTLESKYFNGYMWMKEHQNLIRDRAINPNTKLFTWKKLWIQNDVYRLRLQNQAYVRCQKAWEELEKEAEEEAGTAVGGTMAPPPDTPIPKVKKLKTTASAISTPDTNTPVSKAIITVRFLS
ncbi:hypothetical protein ABW20_dc0103456 [Dactylellina cionopaga]|nr:hypothetical protein ABW20_dc0103456 [Dactylellina cionopaga]